MRMFDTEAGNRRWDDFRAWLAEREFPHVDDRWRRRARSEDFQHAVFGRRVDEARAFLALGELLRLALEELVADPSRLPPSARLVEPAPPEHVRQGDERETLGAVLERLGGQWNPVKREWTVRPAWTPLLVARAESSLTIAWLAYQPIWSVTDPERLLPIHDLLRFHECGPGLSAGGLIYELVEAVLTSPDLASLRDLTTALQGRQLVVTGFAWNEAAVSAVMAARLEALCQEFWSPPTIDADLTDPSLLPDPLQGDYLIGMRMAAISQQQAGDREERLDRAQLADLRLNLGPWWQSMHRATTAGAPAIRWTSRFLPTLDACTMSGLGPHTAGLSQLLPHRLPIQIARGFPGWYAVASPMWQGRITVQRFGRRALEDLQHTFQTLAGLYGPRFLTSERANPARQRYPEYVGTVDRSEWLGRKLGQLGIGFYRQKPYHLVLLEQRRARLTELLAAEKLALWEAIAAFLNGDDPTLPVDQSDADRLARELDELYTRDRVDLPGISIRRFVIHGDQWAFEPPNDARGRRIALWKVLFDELDARGLAQLRNAARPSRDGFQALSDLDPDLEADGAPGVDHGPDADGAPGDDHDADDASGDMV